MTKTIILIAASLCFVVLLWIAAFIVHGRQSWAIAPARQSIASQPSAEASPRLVANTTHVQTKPTPISKADAKGMVSFEYKWGKDGFGTVMVVDFTFTNRSPYPAKDITVTCTHFAPSGTEIDSNTRTIYEIIPANGKKAIKGFNMGFIHSQATNSSCEIDDFVM